MHAKKAKHLRPVLAVAALLLLAAVCVVCDSKYDLQLTEYEISSDRLPKELDGFRIVQLSDLHGSTFGKDNERLVKLVAEQQPDLIVLTGDFAGSKEQLPTLDSLLRGISGLAPVYYINGNHEWAGGCVEPVRSIMEKHGVKYLSNQYEALEAGGGRIVIAGAEDPNGRADMLKPQALAEQLRRDYPEDYVLWLGHRNYWVEQYPELPVDLILSGHAHGGIVRLPVVGGLLNTDHSLGAEYEAGLYYSGGYCMLVSRGLGNSIMIPRIFNRPELVSIVLRSKAE